jgi:hypothetical protein
METLLPHASTAGAAHRGEEGRHIEALLREFLNRHLPKDVRAVSGFIMRPSTKVGEDDLSRTVTVDDAHSSQLDIIVYDFARFPVYEQFEEFVIVPPEGVIAVLSVKKTLTSGHLQPELRALAHVIDLCRSERRRSPFTAIVAFEAGSGLRRDAPKACFDAAEQVHSGDPFDRMVTEVCVISKFTVFKFRKRDSGRQGYAKYVSVNAKDKPQISLQRLINSILSVFYDDSRGIGCKRPGFVSFKKGTFNDSPLAGFIQIGGA